MQLEFTKLHGIGNDFVFINDLSERIELTEKQVAWLCDRHKGIGADGVILVRPSKSPECAAYMHYINSDGSLAQMCGNGVRCFAKYLVDRGYVPYDSGRFVADTLAGPKPIEFSVDANHRLVQATVNMGQPILEPAQVPTALEANAQTEDGTSFVKECPVSSPWGDFRFTCVSMGNPHAVCFIDSFDALPDACFTDPQNKCLATFNVDAVGRFFESHEAFPEKSNIEFVQVVSDGLSMRVYERGCAETMACGTGACAVGVAAVLTGRAGHVNTVHLLGGDLRIEWSDEGDVIMTGAAEEGFKGVVEVAD